MPSSPLLSHPFEDYVLHLRTDKVKLAPLSELQYCTVLVDP